jgi:hypothetical protein
MTKIVILDIIIMVLIVLFPHLFGNIISVQDNYFDYIFDFSILFTYIYSIIKCISGVIFLSNKIKKKMISLCSKLYLLFSIPLILSILFSLLYSYLMSYKIFMWDFGCWHYGDIVVVISIILSIILTIGNLMWLINLTFFDKNIKIYFIILLNIITPIYLLVLAYEVFCAYM